MSSTNLSLFFSNRHEALYDQLQKQLYTKQDRSAFATRLVIAPGAALRSWLERQLAANLGITMGVSLLAEEEALDRLLAYFPQKDSSTPVHYPNRLELSLAIEAQLPALPDPQLLAHLGSSTHTRRYHRRLVALSDTLANVFHDYGRYGKVLLDGWEHQTRTDAWQQDLWHTLFGAGWGYPYQLLENLDFARYVGPPHLQIHLFGISELCPLHHELMRRLARHVPVSYYVLSPCAMYWSDVLSPREQRGLRAFFRAKGASMAQQDTLDDLLEDSHPLLASFGKVGRQLMIQLDNEDVQPLENYLLPGSDTILRAVQSDLLLLKDSSSDMECRADDTLQIHIAPSAVREVEILYDNLLGILNDHSRDTSPITPSDIIVVAPDIATYAPLIKAVFGSANSRLKYQISDLPLASTRPFVAAFLALLRLAQGRWEAPAVLGLFNSPFFARRHQLEPDDLGVIHAWVQKAAIFWGEDAGHRDEHLKQSGCLGPMTEREAIGTWEGGLKALLLGLAQTETHESLRAIEGVDFSKADLLAKLTRLTRSLREDLRSLRSGPPLTIQEWATYLRCLCDVYLQPLDRDSEADREVLYRHFNALHRAGRWQSETKVPLESAQRRLEQSLTRHTVATREVDQQCVRFGSLRPGCAVPARVIALLGMEEGQFPRQRKAPALDLLATCPKADYRPTPGDRDRYLFLECLLSARDHLLISYSGLSPDDGRVQYPCLPLAELTAHVQDRFGILENALTRHHPFYPFDRAYFTESSPLRSYSNANFRAAKALYNTEKEPSHQFASGLVIHCPEDLTIDIRDLLKAVDDPVKLYLNQTLGIYLKDRSYEQLRGDETFALPSWEARQLTLEGLTQPIDNVIERARRRGQLPLGGLSPSAHSRLSETRRDLDQTLQSTGLKTSKPLQIKLVTGCSRPTEVGPGIWHMPALQIGNVTIVGTLDRITPRGLLAKGKGSFEDAVNAWPAFVLLQQIAPSVGLPQANRLIFIDERKTLESFTTDTSAHLEKLVEYYRRCLERPSPLSAEWAQTAVQKDRAAVSDRIIKDLTSSFAIHKHRHLRWILGNPTRSAIDTLAAPWIDLVKQLYIDFSTHWYKGRSNDETNE